MTAFASATLRLISPLAGNSVMRSPTSADSRLPDSHSSCVTSSHALAAARERIVQRLQQLRGARVVGADDDAVRLHDVNTRSQMDSCVAAAQRLAAIELSIEIDGCKRRRAGGQGNIAAPEHGIHRDVARAQVWQQVSADEAARASHQHFHSERYF